MLPAQRAERQTGRVLMSTGNLPLTETSRSSHANYEASSIEIVQQQRKFGKVILRRFLIERQVYVSRSEGFCAGLTQACGGLGDTLFDAERHAHEWPLRCGKVGGADHWPWRADTS